MLMADRGGIEMLVELLSSPHLQVKRLPQQFTTSPLHRFTVSPLHRFTVSPLHRFTTSPLHHFTSPTSPIRYTVTARPH